MRKKIFSPNSFNQLKYHSAKPLERIITSDIYLCFRSSSSIFPIFVVHISKQLFEFEILLAIMYNNVSHSIVLSFFVFGKLLSWHWVVPCRFLSLVDPITICTTICFDCIPIIFFGWRFSMFCELKFLQMKLMPVYANSVLTASHILGEKVSFRALIYRIGIEVWGLIG